jgi:hypothetical protein
LPPFLPTLLRPIHRHSRPRIPAGQNATIERLRATNPTAADYLTRHIVFEDARQTVEYTGIDFPDLELN